jgi:heme exporter protein A
LIFIKRALFLLLAPPSAVADNTGMLSAQGLTCVRGDRPLFAGVDLAVGPGEWLHVRGANGSGKTSLLRLLAGLSHPEAGQVTWDGEPISRIAQDYHRALLFLGHHAAVKEELTGAENLQLSAQLDGGEIDRAEVDHALGRFGLKGREDLPVRVLSAGQKRRVLLARLMTRKAKLWVLDEPFTALDARAVEMLGNLAREHLAQGGMAVITSHQAVPIDGGKALELSSSSNHLKPGEGKIQ